MSDASSCLWGGYDDQLPAGVSTSHAISASASKASGVQKLLTWRLAAPAPRISTGTLSAGWWRNGSRASHTADGRAKRPPPGLVICAVASRGT